MLSGVEGAWLIFGKGAVMGASTTAVSWPRARCLERSRAISSDLE